MLAHTDWPPHESYNTRQSYCCRYTTGRMVAREPTSEEVRGFLEFAGLSSDDEPLAVRALKVRPLETTLHLRQLGRS